MSNSHTTEGFKPKALPTIPDYGPNAIEIKNLTFSYRSDVNGSSLVDPNKINHVLQDLNLELPTGSRCLLIGANGAGKSSLLRILAGRHLTKNSHEDDDASYCRALGLNAFHDTKLNFHRSYLDCDWGMRNVSFVGAAVPLMADIAVNKMMERLQASYPERRDELVEMLGIDLDWRMHQLSDGQRRRVQLFLGLIRPFKILLLDEVTTSLDVCVRQDLLRWLVRESDERGATIIYATHIFDGLDDWATDLFFLNDSGQCGWQGKLQDLEYYNELKRNNHPAKMLAVAEHWLRKELIAKRKRHLKEKPQGENAKMGDVLDRTQGGYSSGRFQTDEEKAAEIKRHGVADLIRQGRLSDMMGNAGVLDKVRRVGGD